MESHERTNAHDVFGGVFEELLRSEVEHPTVIWQVLGAGAGAVLGFILANFGGAVAVSSNPFYILLILELGF